MHDERLRFIECLLECGVTLNRGSFDLLSRRLHLIVSSCSCQSFLILFVRCGYAISSAAGALLCRHSSNGGPLQRLETHFTIGLCNVHIVNVAMWQAHMYMQRSASSCTQQLLLWPCNTCPNTSSCKLLHATLLGSGCCTQQLLLSQPKHVRARCMQRCVPAAGHSR